MGKRGARRDPIHLRWNVVRAGDCVRSLVSLPGRPAGAVGRVVDVGTLFIAVELPDKRRGYYTRQQLESADETGIDGARPTDTGLSL